jgi:hypothetical protein
MIIAGILKAEFIQISKLYLQKIGTFKSTDTVNVSQMSFNYG